jgi:hypothetical protein
LTSTEESCKYAPGTDRDVRACGHFTANQAAASGRDDQKMREINPAHNIATSNIDLDIIPASAPTITASSGNIALHATHATATDALLGVKIGMAVQFKIYAGSAQGSFTTMGTVTAVDNSAKTFSVSNAAAVTAGFAKARWEDADCTVGTDTDQACCASSRCQIRFTQAAEVAELMDEREVEIGDRIRMLTSLGSWETRTVDSVTYTTGFQVSGFVVSEPYENTVSTTESKTAVIDGNGLFKSSNAVCAAGDFCKVTGTITSSDGVYKVDSVDTTSNPTTTTFNSAYGLPVQQASQAYTLTKAHIAYNDGAGTTEAKSCSGRGLCDDSSGECQCFKGYTGVDCSIQNALAV